MKSKLEGFLGNLSLRVKLSTLLLIPALVAVFFAYTQISENQKVAGDLAKMEGLSGLAVRLSALVHETQKERGATGLYMGSGGTEHGSTLNDQRGNTDGQVAQLNDFLGTFDDGAFGSNFESNLASLVSDLSKFDSHRTSVTNLEFGVGDGLGFYTRFNTKLLSLVGSIGEFAPNAESARLAAAYVEFLQGKERAGIERAVLSSVFARGHFVDGEFVKFTSLVTAQDTYLSVFETFASPDAIAFYEETMADDSVAKVGEFREIAMSSINAERIHGVEATDWFAAATARINLLKAIDDHLAVSLSDRVGEMKSSAQTALISTLIIGVASLSVAVFAAFLIANSVSSGIKKVADGMSRIAVGELDTQVQVAGKDEIARMAVSYNDMRDYISGVADSVTSVGDGDLTVDITPKSERDALGVATKRMVQSLVGLVGNVRETATAVSASSQQLNSAAEQAGAATQGVADTAQQVAKGAEDQSASVTESIEYVEKMNSSVEAIRTGSEQQSTAISEAEAIVSEVAEAAKGVTENAENASDGANRANDAAGNGVEAVQKTIEGMERIAEAVGSVSSRVSDLGEKSAEIGKIVSVIDDIAAQTNLLALNAAIEAARAGEQGRGFAVVAEEVRQLAERVTSATSEIAGLIEGVQQSVEESVQATEEGSKQTTEGTELAGNAGSALQQIIEAVEGVSAQVIQISGAASQVSGATDRMVDTIGSVSSVAAKNLESTQDLTMNSSEVRTKLDTIAAAVEESSAAAEEASAGAEEMSAQAEEVVASAATLAEMGSSLIDAVAVFKIAENALNSSETEVQYDEESEQLAA